ncbi:MAG: M48 family metallopeptidase [Aestuariivita sp.]|nr:M48 family metallopeptidase [Aestuariivita sp.]MCY4347847.1 M48 family metallopeptidase [Aestuariivita sp.]
MLKSLPILLALIYGLVLYHFSAWRTRRELKAQSKLLTDKRLTSEIDRLAHTLNFKEISVFVYEIDPINGLAAPDGKIYITRGLYEKFLNGDFTASEIASVVAHELGHVALNHSRRRMIDFSGQNALRAALGMVLARFLPGIGVWVANGLMTLLVARLSRSDEYEADEYAAALLTKAGIGVEPQISLLRKLDEAARLSRRTPPAWLMSHPKTAQRIEALEKLRAKWRLQIASSKRDDNRD